MKELAEKAENDPLMKRAALSMAIVAVFVALVSLLGHRSHTEELLNQSKATDNWSYYQAKNIRQHTYEIFIDLLSVSEKADSPLTAQLKEKYTKDVEKYKDDLKEIEKEARGLEKEVDTDRRKADRFDLGEAFLETGLVIISITMLVKRKVFWFVGLLIGSLGIAVAATGLLVK